MMGGTDVIISYNELQQELEDAKQKYLKINNSIRRIIGRNRIEKLAPYDERKSDGDRSSQKANESNKVSKRKNDSRSVFSRLSAPASARDNEDEPRPRLTSRVIRELPSRQEIVAAQGADSESRARNRRIFGSLLGTLHKFCQEESRLKEKEDKKAQIEKKLEEQEKLERASLKKEREMLFLDRRRKQVEIKKLESKMNRLEDFEAWKSSALSWRHHIRTKTKPYIYYRPKVLNKKTEKLLSDCQLAIDNVIKKRRASLNKDLIEIEQDGFCEEHSHNEDDPYDDAERQNYENRNNDVKDNSISNHDGSKHEPSLSSSIVVVNKTDFQ